MIIWRSGLPYYEPLSWFMICMHVCTYMYAHTHIYTCISILILVSCKTKEKAVSHVPTDLSFIHMSNRP